MKKKMVDPGTIYIKTDKGRAVIDGRGRALNAVQRRLLILIGGKKTVNDLVAFSRVEEFDAAMDHLLQEGLIEPLDWITPLQAPAAPGFVAADVTKAPRPATSPEEYIKLRQQASRYVVERLGDAGEPIRAAIDRCDNPAELRKLLRGIEIFVGQRLSTETAQAFARKFGSLLL